ncbi:hypothetical protein [Candidatus Poriferisodalis sp.]|uniref:hypothetical protein n=1 Tax=Candidatus Poriferisodalis sp. TaxID=3101277 RepID=UPI003B020822
MFRQPQVRRWWAAMSHRWRETVGTVAAVAMVAVAMWWMWPESNDGDATADEAAASQAAATSTLPPPRTATTTTAAPEWPPWCGRYAALRVANDAYDDAQAAYDDTLDAYYAGNEDARFSRRFDARGHHYDDYRAGWDAFHDAQASGNLFSDIEFDPPALARYSAAVDAANGRWTDDLSSLARAAGERGKAWMSLDPAVEALNRAAVGALRSAVPDGVDWLDVKQTCEA